MSSDPLSSDPLSSEPLSPAPATEDQNSTATAASDPASTGVSPPDADSDSESLGTGASSESVATGSADGAGSAPGAPNTDVPSWLPDPAVPLGAVGTTGDTRVVFSYLGPESLLTDYPALLVADGWQCTGIVKSNIVADSVACRMSGRPELELTWQSYEGRETFDIAYDSEKVYTG